MKFQAGVSAVFSLAPSNWYLFGLDAMRFSNCSFRAASCQDASATHLHNVSDVAREAPVRTNDEPAVGINDGIVVVWLEEEQGTEMLVLI